SSNRSSAFDLRNAGAFSNANDATEKSKILSEPEEIKEEELTEPEGETFVVEKILDKFKLKGTTYYKVKWKNYPVKDATNEPEDKLIEDGLEEILDEFNKKLERRNKKLIK